MAYNKTNWVNDSSPAISAENLNKIENELESLDNGLGDVYTKEEIGDLENLTTTDKTSVVNALNEINVPSNWVKVGDTIPTDGREVLFKASKNLFNGVSTGDYFINTSTGATQSSTKWTQSDFIKVNPNTTYVMSTTTNPCGSGNFEVNEYNSTKTWVQGLSTGSETTNYASFTTGNTTQYIIVGYRNDNVSSNIQVEYGSSATTYEPYIEQDLIVNGGKFIADQLVSVGVTNPNDGRRIWFSKSKNLFDSHDLKQSTYICPCKSGQKYTLSFDGSTTSTDKRVFLRSYNGVFTDALDSLVDQSVVNITDTLAHYSITLTTTINGFIYMRTASSISNCTFNNLQVEEGSSATNYEPYIQQGIYVDNEQYGDNYSYNEQVIGKWVDGKKIYRKVFSFNINASAMTTQYTHNIANIETILPSCKALVKRGAVDVYVVPFVYPNSSSDMVNYGIGMNVNSTKITLYIGSSMRSAISSYPAIVVLEYTKSTD